MAVIIALAIMTGLQQELRDVSSARAHIYVYSRDGRTDPAGIARLNRCRTAAARRRRFSAGR
jgi:hypothetical protein